MTHQTFQDCINACLACASECEYCATACLQEKEVSMLIRCIQLDRDCAKICFTAASMLAGGSEFAPAVCRLCAEICEACAEECEKHAHHHDHCRQCAQACRACAQACREMSGVRG